MVRLAELRNLAAIVAAVTALTACSPGGGGRTPTENEATGDAKITIGIADDLPGVSAKAGTGYQGFDIDTANFVAGKLGVATQNITWKPIDSDARIAALEEGEVDLVVDTFSITPEREQRIAFSQPYFVAHQDLLIRRNDDSITGPQTLNGKTLCAASGTTSADYVKSNYKGRITLREVPSWSECVRNLVNGDVDAVSTDDLILAGFALENNAVRFVNAPISDERYGVGIRQDDVTGCEDVNKAITEMYQDGTAAVLLRRWFGATGLRLTTTVPQFEGCS